MMIMMIIELGEYVEIWRVLEKDSCRNEKLS